MVKSDVPPTTGKHIRDLWKHFQILGIFEKWGKEDVTYII